MTPPRAAFAEHFRALTAIPRDDFFGAADATLHPVNLSEDSATMFAGYVGSRFTAGRSVMFVAINPGGGGDSYVSRTAEDEVLYPLLVEFKHSADPAVLAKFERVNEAFAQVLPRWNLWGIFQPTLVAAGCELNEVAYMNVVPYRTRNDKMPPIVTRRFGWRHVVEPTLALLQPRAIITLGKKAGSIVDSMKSGALAHYCVPRVIGDRFVSDEARAVHAQIQASLQ